jgi:glycosyltransferase involved in cell wall biosynthesis
VVIPNGFDTDCFRPSTEDRERVRAELGIPAAAPLVAVIARLDPIKGHQDFVRTWPALPAGVHLLLAGQGVSVDAPLFAQAVAARPDLPARVHLLGVRHDVPRLLAAADLVCCPSRAEGFPNAVGEAMACAVPCVVTDVGDVRALVGQSGWVVPPGDVSALGAALHAALEERPDARARRGRLARHIIETEYSLPAMAGRFEALYASLLDPQAGEVAGPLT